MKLLVVQLLCVWTVNEYVLLLLQADINLFSTFFVGFLSFLSNKFTFDLVTQCWFYYTFLYIKFSQKKEHNIVSLCLEYHEFLNILFTNIQRHKLFLCKYSFTMLWKTEIAETYQPKDSNSFEGQTALSSCSSLTNVCKVFKI